ncbi:PREDICTED: uncharacterized protein LOC106748791 [Dinoponera quadriceps]|uniref:Uncharacterized protein LOC106748791 n=1 Tax=Dinoponera quadriceps TaxID=609295 RepID=A0A6P3XYT0_DINQU|nr:PREDICTED: uncharacterized protein LOC106748791 [Dinoponera quadriceps]
MTSEMLETVSRFGVPIIPFTATNQIPVRTAKEQNREEYNRINALTVFVQCVERGTSGKTPATGHAAKSTGKLPALSATSNSKKSRRAGRNVIRRTEELHAHGNESVCTNVCAKTRLAKIGRQRLSRSSRDLDRPDNLDSRNGRSSGDISGSPRLDVVLDDKVKTRSKTKGIEAAQIKRDIVAENITKQGKKLRANPVRIPATSNFVYEFNPFVGRAADSLTPRTCSQSTHHSNHRGLPSAKTAPTSAKSALNRDTDFARPKTSALPELNMRVDFITGADPDATVTNLNRDARLPTLSKGDQTRTSGRGLHDRCVL